MGHSVGTAADNAVKKSNKQKQEERTPEQIFKDIRSNLDSKLAVTPDDVRFLLEQYDVLHPEVITLRKKFQKSLDELATSQEPDLD